MLRSHLVRGAALAFACAWTAIVPASVPTSMVFVSPQGNDHAAGTVAAPVASLEAALSLARAASREGHATTIRLLPGTYRLGKTVELSGDDSGNPGAPLIIEGDPKGVVRLTGARSVVGLVPLPVSSSPARLPVVARGHVWAAALSEAAWPDLPGVVASGFGRPLVAHGVELLYRGRVMSLAGWPDAGYSRIVAGQVSGEAPCFYLAERERFAAWQQEPEIWVHGYWNQDWKDSYERVQSVDPTTGRLQLAGLGPDGPMKPGQRVRILSALSELDRPGEWYLDPKARMLYFWPPAPPRPGDIELTMLPVLLQGRGARNITLRGLAFEGTRATALSLHDVEGVTVSSCRFENLGGAAVELTGKDCLIESCEVRECGEGGIYLTGGNRLTLTPGNLVARGNRITRVNRWGRCYRPAIQLNGVGNAAESNLTEDLSHSAILFYGNDHRIACNHIIRVCRETADAGAIYSGRDWTARGTVIEGNSIVDAGGKLPQPVAGIYLDDQLSGTVMRNNLFQRVPIGILVGGGRNNLIQGNWFDQCPTSVFLDARGLTWQAGWVADVGGPLRQALVAVPYHAPNYAKYPGLAQVLIDRPGVPLGNLIHQNRAVGALTMEIFPEAKAWVLTEDNQGGIAMLPTNFPSGCAATGEMGTP